MGSRGNVGELVGAPGVNAFADSGGDALRAHIDAMTNEQYLALFGFGGEELRKKFQNMAFYENARDQVILDALSKDARMDYFETRFEEVADRFS